MADSHMFLFAVFAFYGFLYFMFVFSGGAITGLDDSTYIDLQIPDRPDTDNPIIWFLETSYDFVATIVTFFYVMFINPFTDISWMIPLNWAILGTVIYIYLKLIRGGG